MNGPSGADGDTRLAQQLLWGTWPEGSGRPGHTNPTLNALYNEYLQSMDLGEARKKFQERREAEGKSFEWARYMH